MPADRQTDFTVTGILAAACMLVAPTATVRHEIDVIAIRGIAAAEWQHPETQD